MLSSEAKLRAAARYREKRGKESLKDDRRLQRLTNPGLYLLRKTRARAKHKGFDYDLTAEWIAERMAYCEATGLPFSHEIGTAALNNPWAATIDRRDPGKGYTQDNCWVVCWAYNCAKQAWNEETVMKMAQALVRNT